MEEMSDISFAAYEQQGWDRNATAYDEIDLPATGQAFGPLLDSLRNLDGTSLLEIASGTGQLARLAIERGAQVTGVDVAANMIAVARENCPNATFQEDDAESLPFEDGAFDAALCSFGLLHMERPGNAVQEIARVLRPEGQFSYTVWMGPEDGSEFFEKILGAYQKHANLDVGLPPAPPMFALADPAEYEPMLHDAGFGNIATSNIPIEWPLRGRETIIEFVVKGAVRSRMLHERQTPEVQQTIREELLKSADLYLDAGKKGIPSPAILVSATKL